MTISPAPVAVKEEAASSTTGLLAAAFAVTAWGAATVLVKSIGLGGLVIAVYRFTVFGLILAAWMTLRGNPFRFDIMRRSAFGGIALGLDVAFFFTAVKLTSVVNATLIGALQPVVVGVVAARFFGERPRRQEVALAAVALAGVAVVVLAGGDSAINSPLGDLLAFGAVFAWSGYFIASRQSRTVMTSTEFTLGSAIWAGLINLPLAVVFGQEFAMPTARDFLYLAIMTVVAGLIGHSLMNWSLARIPLWVGSTFTLLIPVAAAVIAWAALDEPLTLLQLAGTAVVLGALALIVIGQARAKQAAELVPAPS